MIRDVLTADDVTELQRQLDRVLADALAGVERATLPQTGR